MDINLNIRDRTGQTFSLKTSAEAKSFLEAEKKFWEEQKARLGSKLTGKFSGLPQQAEALISQLNTYEKLVSEGATGQALQQANQALSQVMQQLTQWMSQHWIYRGTPFVEALLSAYEYSPDSGSMFLDSMIKKSVTVPNGALPLNHFVGALMAYEFLLQEESHLVKRRNAERKSFATLRNDLEELLKKVTTDVDAFIEQIDGWRDSNNNSFQSWFNGTKGETKNWLEDTKKKSEDTITDHSNLFNAMAEHVIGRTKELEDLYREKLRLAAPATYWQKRARSLGFQGGLWASLLVLSSIIFTVGAGIFFWNWLHKEPVPFGPQSLQGVALFGATAAAAVYLIRTLSKLTFSALHLQRDAEEREQLTHLYLSLIHEGALDIKSRDIVLQALFSRADSGLLSGDHGPTMPSPTDLASIASKTRP